MPENSPSAEPRRDDTRTRARGRGVLRRIACGILWIFAGMLAALAWWLLDHTRSRAAHFVERRGTLVAAEITTETLASTESPRVRNESVLVRSDTGLEVHFRVLRPARQSSAVPLVVLIGGHRTGRHAVELVGDPGDVAVAALDYPYDGPEKFRGLAHGLRFLPSIQQALLDTPPAVSLALDWLLQQNWVDADRVELAGVSLGTPFAAVAGALDTRFRRVWLIHGGADNRAWLERVLAREVDNAFLRRRAAGLLHLLAHGASFDTADWVSRIAPRPVVIIGAREDESLTPQNIQALYEAAGEPRELIWTEGGHVLPKKADVVRQLLDIVLARL